VISCNCTDWKLFNARFYLLYQVLHVLQVCAHTPLCHYKLFLRAFVQSYFFSNYFPISEALMSHHDVLCTYFSLSLTTTTHANLFLVFCVNIYIYIYIHILAPTSMFQIVYNLRICHIPDFPQWSVRTAHGLLAIHTASWLAVGRGQSGKSGKR